MYCHDKRWQLNRIMPSRGDIRNALFQVTPANFDELCLQVFNYQFTQNAVYREYCSRMHAGPEHVRTADQIPFLPIELFKSHVVISGELPVQKQFSSSGTSGSQTSRHFVCDLKLYEESFQKTFSHFFGDPSSYCFLALLPSYLERNDSSLVYMTQHLATASKNPNQGFFLDDYHSLQKRLQLLESNEVPAVLIGVTFALIEFARQYPLQLKHTKVIETGGMKGRGTEITREALHTVLRQAFNLQVIYSEYGMTELLSQAYLLEDNRFHSPAWMKVLCRDINDPLQLLGYGAVGALNIIDLANLDSCAFIATSDLGRVFPDGSFETLGRTDDSDVRGCNLLWENPLIEP